MTSRRNFLIPIFVCVLAAVAAARCGSGSTTLLSPTEQRCAVTVNPATSAVDADGGTGAVNVTTSRECAWTATTTASWVHLTSNSGQGAGAVAYEVSANRSAAARSAVIDVGGVRATVNQKAANCPFTATPSTITIGSGGGDVNVAVDTEDFCSWNAASQSSWISVGPLSGTGDAELQLHMAVNGSADRHGTVTVGGVTINVDQSAAPASNSCQVSLAPSAATISSAGGPLTVAITVGTGCAWTATSGASWIRLGAQNSGSGSGSLSLTVDPNSGTARSGVVTIGGVTFTVSQSAGSSCTFGVTPPGFTNLPSAGTTVDVSVTAQAGCSWTASSSQNWITVTQGATGSGNGTVRLTVQQNSGGARSGSATIAGQTIPISQAAAGAGCGYSISPGSYNTSAAASSVQVTVSTTSSCSWNVTGLPSWISVSPTSGSGNGTVTVTLQANSGAARTATLTIGTQLFVVTQAAACGYSILPASFNNVSGSGGSTSVTVTTSTGCGWTVSGNPSWITASPASGTGSGNTTITVMANTGGGAARSSTFQIAGQDFSVSQMAGAPCTYTVTPTTFNLNKGAQSKNIAVTTQTGCTATASTATSWITIDSTPPAGGGNVVFSVLNNNGGNPRTGTITITGQSFTQNVTVNQDSH